MASDNDCEAAPDRTEIDFEYQAARAYILAPKLALKITMFATISKGLVFKASPSRAWSARLTDVLGLPDDHDTRFKLHAELRKHRRKSESSFLD